MKFRSLLAAALLTVAIAAPALADSRFDAPGVFVSEPAALVAPSLDAPTLHYAADVIAFTAPLAVEAAPRLCTQPLTEAVINAPLVLSVTYPSEVTADATFGWRL